VKKRYSYLLLEVLIGIGLLALCLTPLTMRPILCFRKTHKALEEIELERIAEVTFADIQENLLDAHPFASIAETKKQAEVYSIQDYPLEIVPGKKQSLARSYQIWKRRHHVGPDKYEVKMVCCRIYLKNQQYTYWLTLENLPD